MDQDPTSEIPVRLAALAGDATGPEVVEEFALELRTELADAGATRIDEVPVGEAPPGARGLEILGICALVITVVQTGEAVGQVVAAVRRVAARFAQRRQRVRVTMAGVDIDLAEASDEEIVRAVLTRRPARATTGVRRALIVANARYDDPGLAQLRAPGHDAEALRRVLGDPAVGGFDVELLQDGDERTIRRRIAAFFADRDRDDVLLLHFSCHGVKDARGRLHLAARDTDLALLGATAIPASFIHDQLAMTQSRRLVLILDCCYSGAFARGSTTRGGGDVPIADEFGTGAGRIVLTASSATEYAFEGGELTQSAGRPSAFTSALVEGIETGKADLDADGEISVDELYDYTYRAVQATTPGQAPMKWSFGAEGNLVIARSRRPAALPGPLIEDLRSERVPLRLEAVNELARLGRGNKPGVRAAALAALAELRDTDDSARVRSAAADSLAGREPIDRAGAEPAGPGAAQVAVEPAVAARAETSQQADVPAPRARLAALRGRRAWAAAALAAIVTAAAVIALIARYDGRDGAAQLAIDPASGPPGTIIEVSGEACPPLPAGTSGGGIVAGFTSIEQILVEDNNIPFDPGNPWTTRLEVPNETPPGSYTVYAICGAPGADAPDSWSYYNYSSIGFEVTEP